MNKTQLAIVNDAAVISPDQYRAAPVFLYLAGLQAESSRSTMRVALNVIARMLCEQDAATMEWERLDQTVCSMLRSKLAAQDAPATVNRKLAALRGVIVACRKLHRMTPEQAQECVDALANVRGSRVLSGRVLAQSEIDALLAACKADETPSGVRDFAIISLLRHTGMRREEVSSLLVSQVSVAARMIQVVGKGNKERIIPLSNGALDAMRQWLALRGNLSTERVFTPVYHGVIIDSGFTPQVIDLMLDKRASQAGVAPLGAHDFRRTFATNLNERGSALPTIQDLMGHGSPQTTSRYIRISDQLRQAAVDSLEVQNEAQ